jgi:hypothetical protein
MPVTRIPIDGLWRCLCPAIDTIASAQVLPSRILPRKVLLPRTSSNAPFRPRIRPFHSSTRTPAQWGEGWATNASFTSRLPEKSHAIPPRSDHDPITLQRTSPANADKIAGQHELLRVLRTQEGTYHKITNLVEYLICKLGDKPALIHYESLIRANADAEFGSADMVRKLFAELKQEGFIPDSGLYHGILEVRGLEGSSEYWLTTCLGPCNSSRLPSPRAGYARDERTLVWAISRRLAFFGRRAYS